jgi:PAS domain S-box-containing protein
MSSSPDGRPLRMLGTHTDINKRKQMEEELAASRRILQEVADNSPALIFITDINGRFLLVSRHAESAVGSPRERVIGKTREEVLPKDVATVHLANDRQVILTGQPMTFEEENFEKDGRHVYLSTKFPLFDVDGTVYGVGCISTDITERKQTEEALQISLREKQALLKEVHHRVKNNLQVITSLLRLESARIEHPTTRSVLRGMQDRIRSMALLHETLYRSENFAQVDMKMYLGQIVAQLFRAQSAAPSSNQPGLGLPESAADIRMELDIAAVQLGVDQAIPCGLIVNELVSNCLKHGFPNGRAGVVRVEFGALDGGAQLRLCVSDDGVGLPTNLAYRQGRSLGLQLVSDLAGQLGGRLELDSSQGTSFAVRFVPVTGGDTQLFRKE